MPEGSSHDCPDLRQSEEISAAGVIHSRQEEAIRVWCREMDEHPLSTTVTDP